MKVTISENSVPDEISHTDIHTLLSRIYSAASAKGYRILTIGRVDGIPIWILLPPFFDPSKPNLLILAGTHGEEPASCFSIMQVLETTPREVITQCNVSFIPIFNPSGIARGTRRNIFNENPNLGWIHPEEEDTEPISVEAKFLLRHLPLVNYLCKDGFLTMHEDVYEDKFFMYCYEEGKVASEKTHSISEAGQRHFPADTEDYDPDSKASTNGITFNQCDGSLDDFLYHEGSKYSICTETPGKEDFDKRVACGVDIIETFIVESVLSNL